MKSEIVKLFASSGMLLDPRAAALLMEQENPVGYAKKLLPLLKTEYSGILNHANIKWASEKKGVIGILKDKDPGVLKVRSMPTDSKIASSIEAISKIPIPTHLHQEPDSAEDLNLGEEVPSLSLEDTVEYISVDGMFNKPDLSPVEGYSPSFTSLEPRVDVIREITGESLCEGKKENFFAYFSSRFEKMKSIFRRNSFVRNAMPVKVVKKRTAYQFGDSEGVSVIGMVAAIHRGKTGETYGLDLEDETGRLKCGISRDRRGELKNGLVLDETIAVIGKMARNRDIFYIDRIINPGVPWGRRVNYTDEKICAVFISDIHAGSNTFLEKQWISFLKWINGGFPDKAGVVNRIKYLVINGDNVDGIGIYPDHKYDLRINNIYKQYEFLGEYLKMVPEHIEIIMIPGNHDAVRKTEPQPALRDCMMKYFPPNVRFLGNPSLFRLHGTMVMAYHGASIDDWITALNHLNYSNPIESMKEMMVRRHILPMYGLKTPLAPEKDDHLIIDPVPDIFITGHTHSFGIFPYRNTLLINGSTWQSQTDYQKMHNFNPIPAKVTVVDLNTMKPTVLDFMDCRPDIYRGG
jgi:DNA polymerase II small subunit